MKSLNTVLLFVICLVSASTRGTAAVEYPKKQDIKIDDTWSLGEGKHNDKPLVIRFRQNLLPLAGHPEYPNRLKISWTFRAKTANGMPTPDEGNEMGTFEDRLVEALEKGNQAILTVVVTNDGKRDWYFYTSDVTETGKRINDMPQEKEAYPVQISVARDEAWDFYRDISKDNKR